MIRSEQLPQGLKALQRLIIHSKDQALDSGTIQLAELLNDLEMLPEYLADDSDRTEEFLEMLQGIARTHPSCRYIVEEFERASTPATSR
jgi:hypothetical protein